MSRIAGGVCTPGLRTTSNTRRLISKSIESPVGVRNDHSHTTQSRSLTCWISDASELSAQLTKKPATIGFVAVPRRATRALPPGGAWRPCLAGGAGRNACARLRRIARRSRWSRVNATGGNSLWSIGSAGTSGGIATPTMRSAASAMVIAPTTIHSRRHPRALRPSGSRNTGCDGVGVGADVGGVGMGAIRPQNRSPPGARQRAYAHSSR